MLYIIIVSGAYIIIVSGAIQCYVNSSESYVSIGCESIPHTITSCSFDGGPTHKCECMLAVTILLLAGVICIIYIMAVLS